MAITPANFQIFVTTGSTMVREAYSSAPVSYPEFTTTVPLETENYEDGWIGRMPVVREWVGPRIVNEPAPQTYLAATQLFELTYGFDRFKLDDDKLGVYYPILSDLGLQWKRWPEFQIRNFLENSGNQTGARQNGLDGLTNFNTAHPIDLYNASAGTYSNDFRGGFTVGSTTVGGALSGTALGTAVEYMQTYQAEDGERLGIVPNRLMIPVTLRAEAEYILKNQTSAPQNGWQTFGPTNTQVGASDNLYARFGVDYLINHNLKSNTNWYLMDTTKSIKPVRWGLRMAPEIVPRVNPTDPIVWSNHYYQWGGAGRGCPLWSYAWLMAKSGPTAGV